MQRAVNPLAQLIAIYHVAGTLLVIFLNLILFVLSKHTQVDTDFLLLERKGPELVQGMEPSLSFCWQQWSCLATFPSHLCQDSRICQVEVLAGLRGNPAAHLLRDPKTGLGLGGHGEGARMAC